MSWYSRTYVRAGHPMTAQCKKSYPFSAGIRNTLLMEGSPWSMNSGNGEAAMF